MEKTKVERKLGKIISKLELNKNDLAIFEMSSQSQNERILSLKSGLVEENEPWFIVDEKENIHAVIPAKSILGLFSEFRDVKRKNFELSLEKAIWQNAPLDYGDVWSVVMDEIKKISLDKNQRWTNINLERIVKNVKKTHPNLFVDVKEMMRLREISND